jgi:hypothetical protein
VHSRSPSVLRIKRTMDFNTPPSVAVNKRARVLQANSSQVIVPAATATESPMSVASPGSGVSDSKLSLGVSRDGSAVINQSMRRNVSTSRGHSDPGPARCQSHTSVNVLSPHIQPQLTRSSSTSGNQGTPRHVHAIMTVSYQTLRSTDAFSLVTFMY